MTTVSVVIPVRDDAVALPAAVASVLKQQVPVLEIVIAVGPGLDNTLAVAEALASEHESVKVLVNESGRTPAALNLAIAASSGQVIARVDARSLLPADYLWSALETLERTGAANVAAIQVPVGSTRVQRAIAAAMQSKLGSGAAPYRGTKAPRQVKTGYLGVFRRDALAAVGGFDESFIRNQDAELNLRLLAADEQVWVDPRMRVDYEARPTLRALAGQYVQYGWWRYKTARKHGVFQTRQVLPIVACSAVLAGILLTAINPLFALVPIAYCVLVVGAAATTTGLKLSERPTMAMALVTMHFSWSVGLVGSAVRLAFNR